MVHEHEHEQHTPNYGRAFAIGMALNGAFVVIEAVYGFIAGSVALVADSAHNLADVLGLGLAWGAFVLAGRKPTHRRTYGLRKTTILAALANAVFLLIVIGGVLWEATHRLRAPQAIQGSLVMAVAGGGVVVNGASALLFARGGRDMNVRAAFMHLAADAAVSLGVVAAGGLIVLTGMRRIDPVVSIVVSLVIVWGAWGVLRQSLDMALDAVPRGIDAEKVREYLASLADVNDVHDLHIWAMSTTQTALTAHLVMPVCDPHFLSAVEKALHERFEIEHVTLQVETPGAPAPCARSCGH